MKTATLDQLDPDRPRRVENLAAFYGQLGLATSPERRKIGSKAVIVNGVRYESAWRAAEAIGFSESLVQRVCRGDSTTKSFTARWADDAKD